MKVLRVPRCLPLFLPLALFAAQPRGDYVERYDTIYNSLTVEKKGNIVELRARSRGGEALESAVDLNDPLRLVVPYTRSLYAALFFQPKPERVLMIGLGGAGFHRLFHAAYPDALLQTVELDPKVKELCETRMGFAADARTPVALMDGRMYVKRDRRTWDWLILDAFRGGFVPPHLKTEEFYRECAARLGDRGVFVSNLHMSSELFYSDIKTLQKVFPQVVLFATAGRGNAIICAVKYREPAITDPATWPAASELARPVFAKRLDLDALRRERIDLPMDQMKTARVLTDDFSPVEFLDAVKTGNTKEH
ncbi:MAG TPA: fused MFS/spermidine synthase [Opitutaceae bacterium]|nr:fused MFS/spermidine synthase [Opitutaceae bacterium]